MRKLLYLFAVSILASGCVSISMKQYSQVDNPIPINVQAKNFPVFGVAKIESEILPGTSIGGMYDTMAMMKTVDHLADGHIVGKNPEYYINAVREELELAGYEISGSGVFFGYDDDWKARFLVGGRITKAEYNSYTPGAGNFSEAGVIVAWEIYDKQVRKVVYKEKIPGYSRNEKTWNLAWDKFLTLAFRNSFKTLLAKKEFIDFFAKYISESGTYEEGGAPINFYKAKAGESREIDIEEVNKASVAIKTESGHGSGFIINPEGYAVTNYHVVAGRNIFDALLKGGKPIDAQVIRTNPDKDLALIKLVGEEYDYLPLGDSREAKVGDVVYVVGTPLDLDYANSLTKGVLSGIRKDKKLGITYLQTDAAVNLGNSGGPLINMQGEVVGVVSQRLFASEAEGLAFAISIDDAKKYLNLKEEVIK